MTSHEVLVAIDIAERGHELPRRKGGHGGTLTLECFFEMLRDDRNARLIGYPPGYLVLHAREAVQRLAKKGLLKIWEDACGHRHLGLSDQGRGLLARWNEEGCGAHERLGRRARNFNRKCAAPELRKSWPQTFATATSQT